MECCPRVKRVTADELCSGTRTTPSPVTPGWNHGQGREGSFAHVTEVMVNGPDDVYVERSGRLERAPSGLFEGEEAVRHLIERIVGPLGLRVDESSPWADARLPDGSRVQTRFLSNPFAYAYTCGRRATRKPSAHTGLDSSGRYQTQGSRIGSGAMRSSPKIMRTPSGISPSTRARPRGSALQSSRS